MIRSFSILFTLGLAALFSVSAMAESVALPQGQKSDKELFSITLPVRGMSMEQVEKEFGTPQEEVVGVGKPPITRWVYKTFTVYFEDQFVIHAVFHNVKKKK